MKTIYKTLAVLSFVLIINDGFAQAPNWEWAKGFGSTMDDRGRSIVVDAAGNIYTTGWFRGTVDFNPGANTFNLNASPYTGVFISKLNASGNFVWAKSIGGSGGCDGESIALDNSGNLYVTGYFGDTVDFDPGPAVFNLIAIGNPDIFVVKLDSTGNFIWAKGMGGTNTDYSNSISIDGFNNVYTAGYFIDTADFDPGPGIFNLTANTYDIFISKLDSLGNFKWAKKLGGIANDRCYSIKTDDLGNVYTTGFFNDTADFDPAPAFFVHIKLPEISDLETEMKLATGPQV